MVTKRDKDLVARYVELDPNRPSLDEARLVGSGVNVWAIVGYLRVTNGDVQQTAHDYDVPEEAVEAALAYYRRHRSRIDARIAANAELVV